MVTQVCRYVGGHGFVTLCLVIFGEGLLHMR